MATATQWALGFIVGFLILQFGNILIPALGIGEMLSAVLALVLVVIAINLGYRAVHMGD